MPIEKIKENAQKWLDDEDHIFKTETREENEQEAFLCALMAWFKHEFFSWMNSPSCTSCGVCQMSKEYHRIKLTTTPG